VNREDVIAYLLHRMPEEQRLALAERWFADETLYEQVLAVEAELLDGYARGVVSGEERAEIERHLLTSDVQRAKLAVARSLHPAYAPPARRDVPWLIAATASLSLVLAGTSLWLWQQNGSLRRDLVATRQIAAPAPGTLYSIWLPADATRGTGPGDGVQLRKSAQVVRFDLSLNPEEARGKPLTAQLSAGGRTIWKQEPLNAEERAGALVASLWIPSQILSPGAYELKLASGETPIAYYPFRIVPPMEVPAK
jgi:hypothetical protein